MGTSLTGTATSPAAAGSRMNLHLEIEDEEGFTCFAASDTVQVIQPGETPFTVSLSLTPDNPMVGDKITFSWKVYGNSSEANCTLYLSAYQDDRDDEQYEYEELQGTKEFTFENEGSIYAYISAYDPNLDIYRQAWLDADVKEPSPLHITLSPAHPAVGQPVTVSWSIDKDGEYDGHIVCYVHSNDMTKDIGEEEVTKKSGSFVVTPKDGEEISAWMYSAINGKYYSLSTEQISMTGGIAVPAPNVTITYTESKAETGDTIIASYSITGGSFKDDFYIHPQWVRKVPSGTLQYLISRYMYKLEGEMDCEAGKAGRYYLIMTIYDDGWEYYYESDRDEGGITVMSLRK